MRDAEERLLEPGADSVRSPLADAVETQALEALLDAIDEQLRRHVAASAPVSEHAGRVNPAWAATAQVFRDSRGALLNAAHEVVAAKRSLVGP